MPKAGDYYQESAGPSAGLLWTQFPVKVSADSPPKKWQGALQEALAAWNGVIPLFMKQLALKFPETDDPSLEAQEQNVNA